MNKKTFILGGIIITFIFIGMNILQGVIRYFSVGMHGFGPRGMMSARGFGGHHMIYEPHYGLFQWVGFLVFLALIIMTFILVTEFLKKKTKVSSMDQFIDTNLGSAYTPDSSHHGDRLDQWENNIDKKEYV